MTVEFEDGFRPLERSFLSNQFSGCRFRLLARATLDDHVALIRWEPLAATARDGGPRPLRGAPKHATYVLDGAAAPSPGERDRRVDAPFQLVRIDTQRDLDERYPDQFPAHALETPMAQRLHGWWLRSLPLLIVAVALVWVALTLWMYTTRSG